VTPDEVAAIGSVAAEGTRLGLDGGCMLIFLRPGVISFQAAPPSVVDRRRPSLEEAQPWEVSLKSREETTVLFGTSISPLAGVWVVLPAKPSFMRARPEGPESFGARA